VRDMGEQTVTTHVGRIGEPLREGVAGAGRGHGREAQVLEVTRGSHVPRIRDDEASSLMQPAKDLAPRFDIEAHLVPPVHAPRAMDRVAGLVVTVRAVDPRGRCPKTRRPSSPERSPLRVAATNASRRRSGSVGASLALRSLATCCRARVTTWRALAS